MILVAPNKSVKIGDITHKENTEIKEGMLNKKEINRLLTQGWLNDTRSAPPTPEPPPKEPGYGKPPSKYKLNPADLVDKPLQELNLMVKERDASIEPFDTIEEAIAFLSMDYVEETPADTAAATSG